MTVPIKVRQRLNLIYYINSLSYLYNKKLSPLDKLAPKNKDFSDLLIHGSHKQIRLATPKIGYYLNASNEDIERTLKGNTWPIRFLLTAVLNASNTRERIKKYLHVQLYVHGLDESRMLEKTSLTARAFNSILTSGKDIPIQDVNQIAYNLHISGRILATDFQKAGINLSNRPKQDIAPIVHRLDNRTALKDYLRCLAYYHHQSMAWLAEQMGYKYSDLANIIKRQSDKEIINSLRQLPFIFKGVSLDDVRAILKESRRPQLNLIVSVCQHTKNRSDLKRVIFVCTHIHDISPRIIAKAMKHSNNYVSSTIDGASGEKLSRLFSEIAQMLNIPENLLLSALARANVNQTDHAYKEHMNFIINYEQSPVRYAESHSAEYQSQYNHSLNNIKLLINSHTKNRDARYYHNVERALSALAKSFGFSLEDFEKDNFKNGDLTQIKQGKSYYKIVNLHDWPVILRKIIDQLRSVDQAFSLPAIQEMDCAKYLYVNGLNVKHPVRTDTLPRLKKMADNRRHEFTAKFDRTGIKVIDRDGKEAHEFYTPTIILANVRNKHNLVMKEAQFNYTKSFIKVGKLMRDDIVKFTARVKPKLVGTADKNHVQKIEYVLTYPSSVRVVRHHHERDVTSVPEDRPTLTGFAIANNKSYGYDFSFKNYGYARYCVNKYRQWERKVSAKEN